MPVVTAHDPNKLIVNKNKTFRAFSKKNALEYEIKFQNVGKGPAEKVKLRFYNNADIDVKSIEILDFEPKCEICSENCVGSYMDTTVTDDYIEFYFHDIYLPGTRQTDIENRNASKGFVKFALKTEKKIKQKNIICSTEIYFDKEDPIKTNNSKTRFQKRVYFGIEAGTNYQPVNTPKFDLFLRGTFTYRLSKRWFYRAEVAGNYIPQNQVSIMNFIDTNYIENSYGYSVKDPDSVLHVIDPQDSLRINVYNKITNTSIETKKQSISIQVVPLEIRRELSEFISLGFGVSSIIKLASFEKIITQKDEDNYTTDVNTDLDFVNVVAGNGYTVENFRISKPIYSLSNSESNRTEEDYKPESGTYKLDLTSGVFLDVNIGKIYSIPYFGARLNLDYRFTAQKFNPSLQFYLGANF